MIARHAKARRCKHCANLLSLFTEPAATVELHRWPTRKAGPAYIVIFTNKRGLAFCGEGDTLSDAVAAAAVQAAP